MSGTFSTPQIPGKDKHIFQCSSVSCFIKP